MEANASVEALMGHMGTPVRSAMSLAMETEDRFVEERLRTQSIKFPVSFFLHLFPAFSKRLTHFP